jgi:hypothetical protein
MARTPTPRVTKKPVAKAAAKSPAVEAARLQATLGAADALTDRTVVLYDPATGRIAGTHRVLTMPGGAESPDPAAAAEALEIAPAVRGTLAMLRHDGAVAEDREITVAISAGKARLALVKRAAPKPVVRKG